MSNVAEICFRSQFADTEVQICSAVIAVCIVWFPLFVAARRSQIKICQTNFAAINEVADRRLKLHEFIFDLKKLF